MTTHPSDHYAALDMHLKQALINAKLLRAVAHNTNVIQKIEEAIFWTDKLRKEGNQFNTIEK